MNILYIVVTENGIIKTASSNCDKAVKRVGGNPEDIDNDSFIVDITTYNIISTTTEEWEKTLRENEIDSIFEFSNKIILEHTSGKVYELGVKDIIKHIDDNNAKNIWEKALGINIKGVEDDDFDIDTMITNKEE